MASSSVQAAVASTNPYVPPGASAQQASFIAQIWPYALRESKRTGIPVEVFVIQSGLETGWGTSYLFRVYHNPAGIGAFDSSHASQFASLSDGFATYADRLMGKGEAGQGTFVADVQAGASAATLLSDLQNGPWAAGHYGGHGLTDTLSSVYGGQGSNATHGTGGAGGTGGSQAELTGGSIVGTVEGAALKGLLGPVGPLLGLIPGGKGITAVANLAGLFVNLAANWRYVLELFAGMALVTIGTLLIMHDVTGVKVSQVAPLVAKAAAA